MRKKKKQLEIHEDVRKRMITEIQSFFSVERDEDIGDLAAMMVLDFMVEKLGPAFYNQGIQDATKYMQDRLEEVQDIEIL